MAGINVIQYRSHLTLRTDQLTSHLITGYFILYDLRIHQLIRIRHAEVSDATVPSE